MYKISSLKEAIKESLITIIIFVLLLFPWMWFWVFISIITFCPFYHDVCYNRGSWDDEYLKYFALLWVILLNFIINYFRIKRKKRD